MAVSTKAKKTRWVQIVSGRMFGNSVLGETIVSEKKTLINKPVLVNLGELARDIKKQNVLIKFKITEVKEDKAIAEPMSYSLMPSSIRRQVRRGRDKLEDSFLCRTSDNIKVRVKPVVITASNAKSSVQKKLYRTIRTLLADGIAKNSFETIILDLVSTKLQRYIKESLNPIYPIRYCDIRFFGISTEKGKELKAQEIEQKQPKQNKEEAAEKPAEGAEAETQEEAAEEQ